MREERKGKITTGGREKERQETEVEREEGGENKMTRVRRRGEG